MRKIDEVKAMGRGQGLLERWEWILTIRGEVACQVNLTLRVRHSR